jgi:hypothetical protein
MKKQIGHLVMKAANTRYLWIRKTADKDLLTIVDNITELYRSGRFDDSVDKLYQIGSQVKIKLVVEPISTYRITNDKFNSVEVEYKLPE